LEAAASGRADDMLERVDEGVNIECQDEVCSYFFLFRFLFAAFRGAACCLTPHMFLQMLCIGLSDGHFATAQSSFCDFFAGLF
jgi:hypothetical protein